MTSMQERIKQILLTLTPREEKVIKMLFGFDSPQFYTYQIAEHFGVTKKRIHQICEKAEKKLKGYTRKHFQLKFDFENVIIIDLTEGC